MVEDLSDEAYKSLADAFGHSTQWQSTSMIDQARKIAGRVTTRAFLGPELCSNPEWQDIVARKDQEVNAALFALHAWPAFLRPLVNKLSPAVRRYHATSAEARELINVLADHRRRQYQEFSAKGQPLPKLGDNIVWMDELSRGNTYDLAGAQLFMSLAANPTSSDVLTNFVYELGAHPQYFAPLREEIRKEFKSQWDKSFLDRLIFMDSLLKEVMRMNPLATIALQRKATQDITFKDGSTIPCGAATVLSMEVMRDPEVFPNPNEFNPHRFLREAGQESEGGDLEWSTPDPYYLAFGYGKHACPGRWLANNQIKVTVCHLLMMYDWKFAGAGKKPKVVTVAFMNKKEPDARVLYRRRQKDDWAPFSS